jgi:hypothetical protein
MSVQKRTFCDSAPIGTFTEWMAGLASSRLKSFLEHLLHCRCFLFRSVSSASVSVLTCG